MRTQEENKKLANLLFPHRDESNINNISKVKNRAYYEEFYLSKNRSLSDRAEIVRLAPSPTGEFHTGALYMSLLNKIIAKKSNGKYILRIEDTDQKREVDGAKEKFVRFLHHYNLDADEGFVFDETNNIMIEAGEYGPYLQSERQSVYEAFVYDLVSKGYAYPCFMSEADLIIMREEQEAMKTRTGVYGKYAKHKDLTFEEIKTKLIHNNWIIRIDASKGDFNKKIKFKDQFMGDLELSENDEHYVIFKSDKLPTYHLAHLIDDYLMKVTYVTRANEWVPSITKHLQMWNILSESRDDKINANFSEIKIPKYGHLMPINIIDGKAVRKLSKRKDKEATLAYFDVLGYTREAVIAYLLRLMAPSFDDWWQVGNRDVYNYDLNLDELKRNSRGPILDLVKLNSFSSDILGEMNAEKISDLVLNWAKDFNNDFYKIINQDKNYLLKIMNIERSDDKPRKDIRHFSEVENNIYYFYNELFEAEDLYTKLDLTDYNNFKNNFKNSENNEIDKIIKLQKIIDNLKSDENKDLFFIEQRLDLDSWIAKIKKISLECNYEKFGEFMMDIRLIISKKKNTPNMYFLFEVMGKEIIIERMEKFLSMIGPSKNN